jgi:hypothetical protein
VDDVLFSLDVSIVQQNQMRAGVVTQLSEVNAKQQCMVGHGGPNPLLVHVAYHDG